MHFHAILTLILILFSQIFSVGYAQQKITNKDYPKLLILSTADIHGNISNFAKLSTVVKHYRSQFNNVLLLNTGNSFFGDPYSDLHEKPGYPIFALMDRLGYDATTIGLRDFNFSEQILHDRMQEFPSLKILGSNIIRDGSTLYDQQIHESIIQNFPNIKPSIVICALIDAQIHHQKDRHKFHWKLFGENNYLAFRNALPQQHKNNLIFLLSCLGPTKDATRRLYNPNINYIMGSSAHNVYYPPNSNTQTASIYHGNRLSHVCVTSITFSPNGEDILDTHSKYVELNATIPDDPEILQLIEGFRQVNYLNLVFGHAQEELTRETIRHLITQSMINEVDADISLFYQEAVKSRPIPKGAITMRDILATNALRSQIYIIKMNKSQIENLILDKHSLNSRIDNKKNELSHSGFMIKILNLQNSTGIISDLDSDKTYRVAINEDLYPYLDDEIKASATKTSSNVTKALGSYIYHKQIISNISQQP